LAENYNRLEAAITRRQELLGRLEVSLHQLLMFIATSSHYDALAIDGLIDCVTVIAATAATTVAVKYYCVTTSKSDGIIIANEIFKRGTENKALN